VTAAHVDALPDRLQAALDGDWWLAGDLGGEGVRTRPQLVAPDDLADQPDCLAVGRGHLSSLPMSTMRMTS